MKTAGIVLGALAAACLAGWMLLNLIVDPFGGLVLDLVIFNEPEDIPPHLLHILSVQGQVIESGELGYQYLDIRGRHQWRIRDGGGGPAL